MATPCVIQNAIMQASAAGSPVSQLLNYEQLVSDRNMDVVYTGLKIIGVALATSWNLEIIQCVKQL